MGSIMTIEELKEDIIWRADFEDCFDDDKEYEDFEKLVNSGNDEEIINYAEELFNLTIIKLDKNKVEIYYND